MTEGEDDKKSQISEPAIAEESDEEAGDELDAHCNVNDAAWEGLMRAVDRADGKLSPSDLALPIAYAVFEVLEQECGMPNEEVAALFGKICEARKAPWF